jgi:phage head maturation protease
MSKFVTKSSLTVDGNSVHLSIPFSKGGVDIDKRTVSGYATLDNIDSQGDVVTSEASLKAFTRARGNLREMHDKVAVGRVVDFREDEFFDSETGEFYRGIFVTAYISEGAQNTWLKVLDGTLSGFSIGGEINDASSEFVKEAGRTIRFIKDYDLVELSLVDNPANQLANILSITKSAGGSVILEGPATEVVVENVFLCRHTDQENAIIVKAEENADCPVCGDAMENIGWFESGADRTDKVRNIVDKHLKPSFVKEAAPEGGVEMTKKNEETPAEATQVTPDAADATDPSATGDRDPKEVVDPEEEEATAPEAEDVDEVEDDEEEVISKKIDELKSVIHEALSASNEETGKKIDALEKKISEVQDSFNKKASELEDKFSEFGEELTAAKARVGELAKTLEAVNTSAAVKKSADVESAEPVQKSKTALWGTGTFSGESLFR